jgi:glycosyltransferase involved in cell wall biosynthesis
MLWYAANVMHEVYARTGARLRVAGLLESKLLNIYAGAECEMLGQVPALSQFMNEIRVFIAPTRFAAGLPQKLIDAASAGVPIVATSLLADQLGWTPGTDLLVADEPQAFADACQRLYHEGMLWGKLRRNARCRVNERYGAGCLTREVDDLMTSLSGITC